MMFSRSVARPSFLASAVVLAAAITLSACGGGSAGGAPSGNTSTQSGQTSTSTTSSSTTSTSTSTSKPTSPTNTTNTSSSSSSGQTVSLSWTIPTQRTNGDPLPISQLSGYEIYYYADGSSAGSGQVIDINDPTVTTYTTPQLPPATYNFAISAIDTTGLASALSSPVTVTVQ